ncbi:hypothetical protein [Nucisporomicrobium flavum]|uniref:hypothetical protein n=1 Tax=Nucisporomicrobium flavum TaxID=2785915 RepID=UPI001F34D1A7|nr:hypothetical protein [Nucisporomicrobium flavum]
MRECRSSVGRWAAAYLLVVVALGGCGFGDDSTAAETAVNTVQMPLRSLYSRSFAGLDVENDRLVVYRRPDAALDTFVRERVPEVDVEFRDAPYSLDELEPLAARVTGDWHYWSTRQINLKLVTPRADGTGVTVVAAAGDLDAARAEFRQRYGDEPLILSPPAHSGIAPAGFTTR